MSKDKAQKSIRTVKTFSYAKGGVGLNFSLNVDNENEVIYFKELLDLALADVTLQIGGMKN